MKSYNYVVRFVILLSVLQTLMASGASFGEYHPHTRWIDIETHSIVVDAYIDRLVISQKGKPSVIVHGIWQGRAFLKGTAVSGDLEYFGVAYEGGRAAFRDDDRFRKRTFERVHPDPK